MEPSAKDNSKKMASKWLQCLCATLATLIPQSFAVVGVIYAGMLFTPLYLWPLVHLSWTIYDIETAYRGGRRFEWVRRWKLWKYGCQYFPFHLEKTAELDPSKNYIIGFHPHGKLATGAFMGFGTESVNFSKVFPKITPYVIMLDYWLWAPVVRELLMALGTCASSTKSIEYILNERGKGNAAVLVVGGQSELWEAQPYTMKLKLKNRKGFVRLAVKNGADLVPVISFGENEILPPTIRKCFAWIFQTRLRPFFYGWGTMEFLTPHIPTKTPVNIIVGKPIEVVRDENASEEMIDEYHQQYIQSLQQLFDEYKLKAGDKYKDTQLTLY